MKYICNLCGYVYDEAAGDPDNGIAPGTKWEDVPADWVCPLCGAGKDDFSPENCALLFLRIIMGPSQKAAVFCCLSAVS